MTREEHLQRIVAKCRELLAIAEKRTLGEWEAFQRNEEIGTNYCRITFTDRNSDSLHGYCGEVNAAFIASCAGPAEAGWKATIMAIEQARQVIACYEAARIEGLNERLCESQYEPGTLRDLVERRLSYGEAEAINLLDSIIAAWPEELL